MNQRNTLRDPSTFDIAAVIGALDTDAEMGLTAQEAARRLAADGPNELRAAPPVPAWRRMLAQFQDPLVYLLLGAVAVSLVAWAIEGRAGWPVDAIVIALIVVAERGARLRAGGQGARARWRRSRDDGGDLRGRARRAGASACRARELVRGDVLVLGEGDAVGADARLVQAASLRVQEASLTGESEAVLEGCRDAAGAGGARRPPRTWCSRAPPSRRAPAAPSSPPPG